MSGQSQSIRNNFDISGNKQVISQSDASNLVLL